MSNLTLTIPDGYHILTTANYPDTCPYDGTKIHKTGVYQGCYDGEFGAADTFTCEHNCVIKYADMVRL